MKQKKLMISVFGLFIAGIIVGGVFAITQFNNPNQKLSDELMAYCKEELLPAYKDGFMTSLIRNLDEFTRNCTPGDVKLFSMVSPSGKHLGITHNCYINGTLIDTYVLEYPKKKYQEKVEA